MGVGDAGSALYPFLAPEIALLRRLLARDAPVLGICLGSQLLAAAAGARVYPNTRPGPDGEPVPAREVGWGPIDFVGAGASRAGRAAGAAAGRCTGTATLRSAGGCRAPGVDAGLPPPGVPDRAGGVRPAVPPELGARPSRSGCARTRLRARRAGPGRRRAHPRRHRSPLRGRDARSGIACSATSSRSCNSRAPWRLQTIQDRARADALLGRSRDDNLNARARAHRRGGRARRDARLPARAVPHAVLLPERRTTPTSIWPSRSRARRPRRCRRPRAKKRAS